MARSLLDPTFGRRPRTELPDRDELEHLRRLAAALVLRHGEQLLPVFRRLDDECAALDRQSDALMRVRAIAGREPAGATG